MYPKNSENVSLSYFAYLQTHINYGLTLWRRATKNNLKFVQNKVKIALITICFKSSNHSTVSMFHEHQILTLKRPRGSIWSPHPRAVFPKMYLLERRWSPVLGDFYYYHKSHLSWKFHWSSLSLSEGMKIFSVNINYFH